LRLISRNDAFGVKVDNNQKTLIPLGVLNLTEREVRPDKSQMLFDLSTMLRRTQAGSSHSLYFGWTTQDHAAGALPTMRYWCITFFRDFPDCAPPPDGGEL